MLLGIAIAASDELHQSFVPDRFGTLSDILIDSLGVSIAGAILAVRLQRRMAHDKTGDPNSRQSGFLNLDRLAEACDRSGFDRFEVHSRPCSRRAWGHRHTLSTSSMLCATAVTGLRDRGRPVMLVVRSEEQFLTESQRPRRCLRTTLTLPWRMVNGQC